MLSHNENSVKVTQCGTVRCACYLAEHNGKQVLLDTSMPFERTRLLRAIRSTPLATIDAIFLTHSHSDHAANALFLSRTFGCPVFASETALPAVRQGGCTLPKGTTAIGRLVNRFLAAFPIALHRFATFEACPDAQALDDSVIKHFLGESATLLQTSGHSADSVSILVGTVAFIGDTAVNRFGSIFPPFADDVPRLLESWERLLDSPCTLFCPAHGKPFVRETLAAESHKRMNAQ